MASNLSICVASEAAVGAFTHPGRSLVGTSTGRGTCWYLRRRQGGRRGPHAKGDFPWRGLPRGGSRVGERREYLRRRQDGRGGLHTHGVVPVWGLPLVGAVVESVLPPMWVRGPSCTRARSWVGTSTGCGLWWRLRCRRGGRGGLNAHRDDQELGLPRGGGRGGE